MKKYLLCTVFGSVMMANAVFAGEVVMSDDLNSPLYLPAKGQLASETQFTYNSSKGSAIFNGAKNYEADTNSYSLSENLYYNFTGNLVLGLGLYAVDGNTTYDYVNAATPDKNIGEKGLDNPDIMLIYRAIDNRCLCEGENNPTGYIVDLLAGVTPDLITEKSGNVSKDSNGVGVDGNVYSLALRAGKDFSLSDTLQGYVIYKYIDDEKSTEVMTQDKTEVDEYSKMILGTEYQHRFNEKWSVNVNPEVSFGLSDTEVTENKVFQYEYSSGTVGYIGLKVNYNLIPQKASVSLGYGYSKYINSSERKYNTGKLTIEDDNSHDFSLNFKYIF